MMYTTTLEAAAPPRLKSWIRAHARAVDAAVARGAAAAGGVSADPELNAALAASGPGNWKPLLDFFLAPNSSERAAVTAWLDTYARSGMDGLQLLHARDDIGEIGMALGHRPSLDELAQRAGFKPIAAHAQRDLDEAAGARAREARLTKRAADGSPLPEHLLEGQRLNAYYLNSEGFPLPSLGLGKQSSMAGKRTFSEGRLTTAELAARAWIRDNQADLGHLFAVALGLPERPTVEEVDRAVQRAIHKGGLSGRGATDVPGIGLAIPNSPFWLDPRMGFAPRGGHKELQWVEKTGPITEAVGHMDTAQALRYVTQDGRFPFRFLIHYTSGHVSVGSGGYQERDAFLLSPPYAPPASVTSSTVTRKATARDEKDTLIDAFREAGWAYKEASENEYLTAPSDRVRIQIKQRTVRVQHRDIARGGAYQEGTSVGPVKKVVTAPNFAEWVAHMVQQDTTRTPYREPEVSRSDAKKALKEAGSDSPYEFEMAAYRFGFTAGREGADPAVPKALRYGSDTAKSAWALGYAAGKAPKVTGDVESGHGSILIHHSATSGTTVRGDTKPIKDTLKAHGFRWYGAGGFWYVPNSKGMATSPIDLDALKRALGVA